MTPVVGNPSIAKRTYDYDSGILQYAPMRMTLQEDHLSQVRFPINQPSLQFVSFEGPRVTEVGRFLDQKVASVLGQVGFPVPAVPG